MTFTISNPNPSISLTGIGFTDDMSAINIAVAAIPNVVNNCNGSSVTAMAGASSIVVSGVQLSGSAKCTISVDVTSSTVGAHLNTVTSINSTESGTASINASDTLTVNQTPKPSAPTLTKGFNPTTITAGGTSTLTFTIGNPNNSGITNINFTDPIGTFGIAIANNANVVKNCGGMINTSSPDKIVVSNVSLGANATCTFSVDVTSNIVGPHTNLVTSISSTESGAGNPKTSATLTFNPVQQQAVVPTLTKQFGPNPINMGGVSTLTFTVTNPNNSGLTNISFVDNLPNGMTVASNPSIGGTCVGTINAPSGASAINVSGVGLNANQSCTITVNVTTASAGAFNNSVTTISATESGQGSANAKDTLTVQQLQLTGLPTLQKAFNPGTITVNNTSTLTFTVHNPDAVTLTNISFLVSHCCKWPTPCR